MDCRQCESHRFIGYVRDPLRNPDDGGLIVNMEYVRNSSSYLELQRLEKTWNQPEQDLFDHQLNVQVCDLVVSWRPLLELELLESPFYERPVQLLDMERLKLLQDMERLEGSWDEQRACQLQRDQLELLERFEVLCKKRLAIPSRAKFSAMTSPQVGNICHNSRHGYQIKGLLALHMDRLKCLHEKRQRLEELKEWEGFMPLPELDRRLEDQLEVEWPGLMQRRREQLMRWERIDGREQRVCLRIQRFLENELLELREHLGKSLHRLLQLERRECLLMQCLLAIPPNAKLSAKGSAKGGVNIKVNLERKNSPRFLSFSTHDEVFTNKMPLDQRLQSTGIKYLHKPWSPSSTHSHLKLSDILQIANLELNATNFCFFRFLNGYTNHESMVKAVDTYNHLSEISANDDFLDEVDWYHELDKSEEYGEVGHLHKACILRTVRMVLNACSILSDAKFKSRIAQFHILRDIARGHNTSNISIVRPFGMNNEYHYPFFIGKRLLTWSNIYTFHIMLSETMQRLLRHRYYSNTRIYADNGLCYELMCIAKTCLNNLFAWEPSLQPEHFSCASDNSPYDIKVSETSAKRSYDMKIGSDHEHEPYLSVHHPLVQMALLAHKRLKDMFACRKSMERKSIFDVAKILCSYASPNVCEARLISPKPKSESLNAGKNSEINSRKIIARRNELENELQHPRPGRGIKVVEANTSATWTVATAAPHHATGNRALLSGFITEHDDQFVHAVDGVPIPVRARGAVVTDAIVLPDVWFVPGLAANLVSVSQLAELNYSIRFGCGECCIRSTSGGTTVGKAHLKEGGLYVLDFLKIPLAM